MSAFVHPRLVGDRIGGYIDPLASIGAPPEDASFPRHARGLAPEIDRSARIEAFVSVDAGFRRPTAVGESVWLLKHSHVGHDALIQKDVLIATGAVIGGYAVVCEGARIGLNATVLPFRTVGKGATVGAGAVVTQDVPEGWTVIGNPARRLETRNPVPFSERGMGSSG